MTKMKAAIKKILTIISKFDYKQYAKTNILFFSAVGSLLVNTIILRVMTVGNFFEIKPILADLGMILILMAPAYLLKPRKQIIYVTILSIISTAICVINSMYFTYYASFASISILSTSLQLLDVSDAISQNVMELKDFIYIWQPLLILFIHFNLNKKSYYSMVEKIENGKKRLVGFLIGGLISFCLFSLTLSDIDIGRLVKQWNREFIVMKFGIYTYQLNDAIRSIEPKINAAFGYDKAARKIKAYYEENNKEHVTNKYTNMFKGKNLLTIHAESIQQFVIGLKFNGVEVTPNLNRLTKEGLYFSNFYPQVGVGTSSDTEFTLNTSLLPSTNGTVFISYWNRDYISIPKLLKEQGYYTFSMHGNKGDMWNRAIMHKQLGYDKFYSKTEYKIDDIIGMGLSDKSFFKQSIQKIKTISQKYNQYYGTLIMLSNHTPFDQIDKYGDFPVSINVTKTDAYGVSQEVTMPYMEGTKLGNYFKSVHYADAAIGELMAGLEAEGLLKNTVILIYGDHDARLPISDYNRFYNYDPYTDAIKLETDPTYKEVDYYSYELNRKVPLIIWSNEKKLAKEVTEVTGMYDILPTVGNMFGFSSQYQLGNDIFSTDNNVVTFPNGSWLTRDVYYNVQKQEFKLLNENAVITQDYIDKYTKESEEKIGVSDGIITYDYIKKSLEAQKLLDTYKK